MGILKNIESEQVLDLAAEIQILKGQVASKTLVQNPHVSITLFAFDKDEEISTHTSKGDAFVSVLEGTGQFTIDGKPYLLNAGESIIMPAEKPHAIFAVEPFKWILTVVFPN